MPNYNKVLLMGNLTRDIELKYTAGNQPVADIGIAVNRRYKTKEGEDKEEVTFVDCEAWGRTAEVMNQYLGKGKPVFLEGRLKLDQWQDKDGKNRTKLRVVIDSFQFVETRGGGQGGRSAAPGPGPAAGEDHPASVGSGHQPVNESDIPF